MSDTSAENAEWVSDLTDNASKHLLSAYLELAAAVERAEDDYPHNGDRLRDALGALRLVQAVVSTEHYTWADYARARNRRESAEVRVQQRMDGTR